MSEASRTSAIAKKQGFERLSDQVAMLSEQQDAMAKTMARIERHLIPVPAGEEAET